MSSKTKIVYCLSASESSFYAEQLFLSLVSLRLFNPRFFVSILVDTSSIDECSILTKRTIDKIFQKADEVIYIDYCNELNNKIRSRLLKTSARECIMGDFIYLDCDTIVCSNLDIEIDKIIDIAAVYNTNVKELSSSPHYHAFQYISRICNVPLVEDKLFNGGVIYAKDSETSRAFYSDWNSRYKEFYKKYGITSDQISLYATNISKGSIISPLPGEWNCQLGYGINEMAKAKIIHTLTSSFKQRGRENTAIHVLQQGHIYEKLHSGQMSDEELVDTVVRVKQLFLPDSRIVHKNNLVNKMIELRSFSEKYTPLYLYSGGGEKEIVVNAAENFGIFIKGVINENDEYFVDKIEKAGICVSTDNNTNVNHILEVLIGKGFRHIFIL